VGIENSDVPGAEVIAVIPFPGIAGTPVPIAKITSRGGPVVFVVSRSRTSAGFESAPGRAITFHELFIRTALIRQVTSGEDRSGNSVNQFGGGFSAGEVRTAHNISRANQRECIWGIFLTGLRRSSWTWRPLGWRFLCR